MYTIGIGNSLKPHVLHNVFAGTLTSQATGWTLFRCCVHFQFCTHCLCLVTALQRSRTARQRASHTWRCWTSASTVCSHQMLLCLGAFLSSGNWTFLVSGAAAEHTLLVYYFDMFFVQMLASATAQPHLWIVHLTTQHIWRCPTSASIVTSLIIASACADLSRGLCKPTYTWKCCSISVSFTANRCCCPWLRSIARQSDVSVESGGVSGAPAHRNTSCKGVCLAL